MFLRLTSFKLLPDKIQEAKQLFNSEVMPVVRQQKGNINILLLEPTDMTDDFISLSQWESKADADAYDNAGTYRELVKKLEGFLIKQPVLKSYSAQDALVSI